MKRLPSSEDVTQASVCNLKNLLPVPQTFLNQSRSPPLIFRAENAFEPYRLVSKERIKTHLLYTYQSHNSLLGNE
jgi:hypothetical protein